MDPGKKSNHVRNQASQIRKQIFQWISTLSPSKIKDVFTIREEQNIKILEKIFNKQSDQKKKLTSNEIAEGGFNYIKDKQQIYYRARYNYKFYHGPNKNKNARVAELAKQLYENLVISRVPPYYVSIRVSFLKQLEECMDELSKNQLLYFVELQTESAWFSQGEFHSFAEWIVFMFECEIKKAYFKMRELNKSKRSKIPEEVGKTTFYQYMKQHSKEAHVKQLLQKVIQANFLKQEHNDAQNRMNKKNFHLKQCLERLGEQPDPEEFLISFYWYRQSSETINFQIFGKLAEVLYAQYKQWSEYKPFEDWEKKEEEQKQKKRANKLKKKHNKKNKEDKKQESDENRKKQLLKVQDKSNGDSTNTSEQTNIEPKEEVNLAKVDLVTQEVLMKEDKVETNSNKVDINSVEPKIEQGQDTGPPSNLQLKVENSSRARPVANKKIIRDRISEYYQFFANQLVQNSSAYDKYRKTVFEVMENFMREKLFVLLNKTYGIQHEWKLQIYGSSPAGFSLEHSDIDLVLLTNNRMITLDQINQILKVQEWAHDSKVRQAFISIITLQVQLQYSEFASKSLTTKQLKKITGYNFNVDMTISTLNEPHSGIQSTKQLREIYENHPNVRSVCIILKEFFRVRGLNKPYSGGVGSYVLIILIHAILTRKNIIEPKKDSAHPDIYKMIKEIADYMDKFVPFETVISATKNTVKPDQHIDLNIVNPKTGNLIRTSAFKIRQIIKQLNKLRKFQDVTEEIMHSMNINEKRNMKTYFLNSLHQFLYQGDMA